MDVAGATRWGTSSVKNPFDYVSALLGIRDGIEGLIGEKPLPGRGILKPEVYNEKLEKLWKEIKEAESEKDTGRLKQLEDEKRKLDIQNQMQKNTPSGKTAQAQLLICEITKIPDTIRFSKNDSTNTDGIIRRINEIMGRDTVVFHGEKDRIWMQEEWLRRRDTTYKVNIQFTRTRFKYQMKETGEIISKQRYDELKRSE